MVHPLTGEIRLQIFWISSSNNLIVRSFEWRALRLHTWKLVRKFGDFREIEFDMFGDSCENLLEILTVLMGARQQGALAQQLWRATPSSETHSFPSSESHPKDLLIFTDFGVSQAVLFFVARSLQVCRSCVFWPPKTRVFWKLANRRTRENCGSTHNNAFVRRVGFRRGIFGVFGNVLGAAKRQGDAGKTTFQTPKTAKIGKKRKICQKNKILNNNSRIRFFNGGVLVTYVCAIYRVAAICISVWLKGPFRKKGLQMI